MLKIAIPITKKVLSRIEGRSGGEDLGSRNKQEKCDRDENRTLKQDEYREHDVASDLQSMSCYWAATSRHQDKRGNQSKRKTKSPSKCSKSHATINPMHQQLIKSRFERNWSYQDKKLCNRDCGFSRLHHPSHTNQTATHNAFKYTMRMMMPYTCTANSQCVRWNWWHTFT